jgi:type I restriction enzyme, S subunit
MPADWEARRIKTILREQDERSGDSSGLLLSLTRARGLVPQEEASARIASVEDLSKYKVCRPGNLVMNRMQAWSGMFAASYAHGLVSPDYSVFERIHASNIKYLEQLLRTPALVNEFARLSKGIGSGFNRLYTPDFGSVLVVFPPLPEQTAIVRFLDHADRRIRRYIRAKKKLIALLNEQKQAIIHRAVTRGLDPDVRLKDSEVEWLGDVPEHWDVAQIRSVAHVVRGSSPRPAGSPLYFHGTGLPWITVGEITKDSGMHLAATTTRLTPAGEERSRRIDVGTLLLTNSGATLGVPKISLIQGCINDGVAALLRLKVNEEFMYLYLTTQTSHLRAWVYLGAQPNLNTQIVGSWPVILPPLNEQSRIVDHVKRETAFFEVATGKIVDEVSRLHEYRTRLIADVVTGKVDVREAAARLPEEAEEVSAESEELEEGEGDLEDADPEDFEEDAA